MEMKTEQVRLNSLAREVDKAQEALEAGVIEARAAGLSWAEVAFPLGITRQAAQQRFGPVVAELIEGWKQDLNLEFRRSRLRRLP